jgi:hypothetical protein
VSASASLSVAPPLQRTVRFSSVGEGLQVAWSACNRTATDLHAVSTSLGETAPAGREALAPGQCVEATATVAPAPGQAAALQTLVARFGSREGVAVETRLQANVWPVPRATRTIEVDGSLGEWPELPVSLPLTPEAVPLDSGSAHGRFALMAGQSWLGPRDTSAKVGLLQDERSLYLAADVTDDRHFQPETGAEVWQGDNIQLAVDFDPTQHLPPAREAGGPCEIGLTLGGRGAEVFRWLPFGGPAEGQGPLTARVPCAVVREGDRTRYEAAIPWQALLAPPGWRPTPGAVLGFALLINDNDSAGRKGWLQLFDGIGYGKSRDKYGLVILAA